VLRFRICGSTFAVLEDAAGEVLLRTPPLCGTLSCRAMIVNIRLTAQLDKCYDRTVAVDGYGFALQGPNGTPIAVSPLFASAADRDRAIAAVRRHAAAAPVEHAPLDATASDRARVVLFDGAAPRDREATAPTTSHDEHLVTDEDEVERSNA
jgi:uncharacterized protein YegP (UPF0339 family)